MKAEDEFGPIERFFANLPSERRKSKEMSIIVATVTALFFMIVLLVGGIVWLVQL